MTVPDYLENVPNVVEFGGAIGRTATAACKQGQHDLCSDEACQCRCHCRVAGDIPMQPTASAVDAVLQLQAAEWPCLYCPSTVRHAEGAWRHTEDGSRIRTRQGADGVRDHHVATPDYGEGR